jgi:hypothetical protein
MFVNLETLHYNEEVKELIVFISYGIETKVGNTKLFKDTHVESKSLTQKSHQTKGKGRGRDMILNLLTLFTQNHKTVSK